MKTVCKKLLCLMLVAMMLVSAVPFAFATESDANKPTHEITFMMKAGTSDEVLDTYRLTYVEGHEVYAGRIARNLWSDYGTFQKFWVQATGTTYDDINAYFIAEEDTDVVIRMSGTGNEGGNEGGNQGGNEGGNQGGNQGGTQNPPAPTYGTLYVTVYTYNAKNEAYEAGTVSFSGKASYKLSKELAEECFDEVNIVNYEEYRWQPSAGTVDMTDGDQYVNLVVDPIRTPGNRKIVTLTINHNRGNGNDDRQTIETLAGTKILSALSIAEDKGYFDEPSRKGYRLAGYSFDMNCSNDINRDDVINADMTIFCEWERNYFAEANKYDVSLRVYTNGDTQYVDKVLNMEDYAGDGKITRTEVEKLLNKKYSAKSGYTLAFHGLFTAETWDDGDYDLDDAVSTVKVNDYGKTVIYVMVKNVKKAVADSSNPKTGDNIMIAVSTMALSAAALVSIVELKKRKMI